MASTVSRIEELSRETAEELVRDPARWMAFLQTASRIYLYPFPDQLLIFAQRPEATACASLEIWNERMHCRIRRGSVGIALIDEQQGRYKKLRYVFDAADTYPMEGIGRRPAIWMLPADRTAELAEYLSEAFQTDMEPEERGNLYGTIVNYARVQAEAALEGSWEEMRTNLEGCRAERSDEETLRNALYSLISESAAYTMAVRCGIGEDFQNGGFQLLPYFDTEAALHIIGGVTQEICRPFLKEIGRYLRGNPIKKPDSLEKREEGSYNEFNTLKHKSRDYRVFSSEGQEDRHERETQIQTGGRSADTGSGDRPGAGGHREVRRNAAEVFERTPQDHVRGDAVGRNTEPSPGTDQRAGDGTAGGDRGRDAARESRAGQSDRSDGLGETSERAAPSGGGDRAGRDSLQINGSSPETGEAFPGEDEQTKRIVSHLPLSERTQMIPDVVVDMILRTGGGERGSLLRITAALRENSSGPELSEILSEEYGTGGKGFMVGGRQISLWYDSTGMDFAFGDHARGNADLHLSWEDAGKRILAMYKNGVFASGMIDRNCMQNEREEIASAFYFLARDGLGKVPEAWKSNYEKARQQIAGALQG